MYYHRRKILEQKKLSEYRNNSHFLRGTHILPVFFPPCCHSHSFLSIKHIVPFGVMGVWKGWACFDHIMEYLKSWETRGKVTNQLSPPTHPHQTGAACQFGYPDLFSLQAINSQKGNHTFENFPP